MISELALTNVRLAARDASAPTNDLGDFDYVISHGVYSWIPETARDGLLENIKRRLRPNGIGYVSFSCYPGAYFRQVARELMSFHAGALGDPTARLEHGIGFLRTALEADRKSVV